MAVENFVLGKIRSVVRWLVRKQPFLPFLTQPGPTLWPQKAKIENSFRHIFLKLEFTPCKETVDINI